MALEPLWVLVAFAVAVTDSISNAPGKTPDTPTGMSVSGPVLPTTFPSTSSLNAMTWSETSPSPTIPETTDGNDTTSRGITELEASTAVSESKEPVTSQEATTSTGNTTTTDGTKRDEDDSRLSKKPGLVAVICIFLSVLLVGAVVVVVKCFRTRGPAFQKLDEVPMRGKAAEDSPFARYPPK